MPTKNPRVAVTLDEELEEALSRVEALNGQRIPRAKLLRDLALKGAEAVIEEESARRKALEELARLSTKTDWLYDREVLLRLDEEAWRH
jgi:hypothetical protein